MQYMDTSYYTSTDCIQKGRDSLRHYSHLKVDMMEVCAQHAKHDKVRGSGGILMYILLNSLNLHKPFHL